MQEPPRGLLFMWAAATAAATPFEPRGGASNQTFPYAMGRTEMKENNDTRI